MDNIGICIPATKGHVQTVGDSLNRLFHYGALAQQITIVSPHIEYFQEIATKHAVKIVSDDDCACFRRDQVSDALPSSEKSRKNWYFQQLLKFDFVRQSSANAVLVLDADTVMLENPFALVNVFCASKERHEPYYEHYRQLTGFEVVARKSAIVNFMWFKPQRLRQLLKYIEARMGADWWKAILSVVSAEEGRRSEFSEYEVYANWCLRHYDDVALKDFNVFRRGDLIWRRNDLLDMLHSKGYGAVAFECNHESSLAKVVAVNLIFYLSLKYW